MLEKIKDIQTRDDIKFFVDNFYNKLKSDPMLGPVFNHVDWVNHLPKMYNFWSSLLLGDHSYKGNPFQHHVHLPIGQEHFTRWLLIFHGTINENFSGTTANEVKARANAIAGVFQLKMGLLQH